LVFFGEIYVFLELWTIGLFGGNRTYCNLKIMIFRKYSFQKLTQVLQSNNVLEAHASDTDGFLSRDTCVSST
jgi:hypothetical protein